MFEAEYTLVITNLDIRDLKYNAKNQAVYNCEFLDMLRHSERFVVRKLFKIKKDPNIKTCNHTVHFYVHCMYWLCIV
jgi:hypothetical protein